MLFGRVEGLRFTEGLPRDKVVLSADGDIGKIGITRATTRYGKVLSPGAAVLASDPLSLTAIGPDDIRLGAKWITDLEARYKIGKLDFAIGANNVFDVYPDRSPFGARPASVGGVYPANQEYIPYSIFSPFGFNGRFLYGRSASASRGASSRKGKGARGPFFFSADGWGEAVAPIVIAIEQPDDRRMVDWIAIVVGHQILLADVCDVARLGIFRRADGRMAGPCRAHILRESR